MRHPRFLDPLRRQARGFLALLPRTRQERLTFAVLAVTAGICEEIVFRGFGFAVRAVPVARSDRRLAHRHHVCRVRRSPHLYQGPRGVVLTGLAGAAFASMTVTTGSLLPAIAVHAMVDLRILGFPDLARDVIGTPGSPVSQWRRPSSSPPNSSGATPPEPHRRPALWRSLGRTLSERNLSHLLHSSCGPTRANVRGTWPCATAFTPACRTRRRRAARRSGRASRTSGSTGSRSGTTSTRPTSRRLASASKRSPLHAALACDTTRVRCGSLVYCAGYRHPAVLANAITTIDHLQRRPRRHRARRRLGVQRVRGLRHPVPVDRDAPRHPRGVGAVRARCCCATRWPTSRVSTSRCTDARCDPKPVQAELPIWIGGRRREAHAAHRRAVRRRVERAVHLPRRLRATSEACSPSTAPRSAAIPARSAARSTSASRSTRRASAQQFGGLADGIRPGVLTGPTSRSSTRIGRYVEAGADQINIAMRAPFDDRRPRAARTPDPVAVTSEIREDALTGATVAVAAARQGRPNLPSDACPFCVGGIESPEPYDVRAFVNRWPTFADDRCEVVLYTPRPRRHVLVARRRRRAQGRRPVGGAHVQRSARATTSRTSWCSRTAAPAVGATIPHPHGQIYAYDIVPPTPLAELRRARRTAARCAPRTPALASSRRSADGGRGCRGRRCTRTASSSRRIEHDPDLPSLPPSTPARPRRGARRCARRDSTACGDGRCRTCCGSTNVRSTARAGHRPHLHIEIAVPERGPGVLRYVAAGESGQRPLRQPGRTRGRGRGAAERRGAGEP